MPEAGVSPATTAKHNHPLLLVTLGSLLGSCPVEVLDTVPFLPNQLV